MGFIVTDIAVFVAGYAFPLLPYELFVLMPFLLAYLIEKPTDKITARGLVVFMTYWGAIYGAGVHTLAITAVLGSQFKMENFGWDGSVPAEGICHALPPPTPGPWCVLLMGHVFLMLPMGYYFVYVVFAERKKFGKFLAYTGLDPQAAFYERAAFYFIVGGISGNLPYFGQLTIQGLDVFAGPGVYTDNGRLPSWYDGRGYVEFAAYSSWILCGIYFLIKACAKSGTAPKTMM